MAETCDEYSTVRKGRCGRPLDERGYCDRPRDHGEHLEDREPVEEKD